MKTKIIQETMLKSGKASGHKLMAKEAIRKHGASICFACRTFAITGTISEFIVNKALINN